MFERFTDSARRVVVLAQECARVRKHDYIGTEHLLLAMLSNELAPKVVGRCLTANGVDEETVSRLLDETVAGGEVIPSGPASFTPGMKDVLQLALREALKLGHNYISDGHLLLALLRQDPNEIAIRLLTHERVGGIKTEVIRAHCTYLTSVTDLGGDVIDLGEGAKVTRHGNQTGSYVRIGPFADPAEADRLRLLLQTFVSPTEI